ncbi:hypothetical protein JCM8547_004086 [Rhodosporidiobolus lusitaniae]
MDATSSASSRALAKEGAGVGDGEINERRVGDIVKYLFDPSSPRLSSSKRSLISPNLVIDFPFHPVSPETSLILLQKSPSSATNVTTRTLSVFRLPALAANTLPGVEWTMKLRQPFQVESEISAGVGALSLYDPSQAQIWCADLRWELSFGGDSSTPQSSALSPSSSHHLEKQNDTSPSRLVDTVKHFLPTWRKRSSHCRVELVFVANSNGSSSKCQVEKAASTSSSSSSPPYHLVYVRYGSPNALAESLPSFIPVIAQKVLVNLSLAVCTLLLPLVYAVLSFLGLDSASLLNAKNVGAGVARKKKAKADGKGKGKEREREKKPKASSSRCPSATTRSAPIETLHVLPLERSGSGLEENEEDALARLEALSSSDTDLPFLPTSPSAYMVTGPSSSSSQHHGAEHPPHLGRSRRWSTSTSATTTSSFSSAAGPYSPSSSDEEDLALTPPSRSLSETLLSGATGVVQDAKDVAWTIRRGVVLATEMLSAVVDVGKGVIGGMDEGEEEGQGWEEKGRGRGRGRGKKRRGESWGEGEGEKRVKQREGEDVGDAAHSTAEEEEEEGGEKGGKRDGTSPTPKSPTATSTGVAPAHFTSVSATHSPPKSALSSSTNGPGKHPSSALLKKRVSFSAAPSDLIPGRPKTPDQIPLPSSTPHPAALPHAHAHTEATDYPLSNVHSEAAHEAAAAARGKQDEFSSAYAVSDGVRSSYVPAHDAVAREAAMLGGVSRGMEEDFLVADKRERVEELAGLKLSGKVSKATSETGDGIEGEERGGGKKKGEVEEMLAVRRGKSVCDGEAALLAGARSGEKDEVRAVEEVERRREEERVKRVEEEKKHTLDQHSLDALASPSSKSSHFPYSQRHGFSPILLRASPPRLADVPSPSPALTTETPVSTTPSHPRSGHVSPFSGLASLPPSLLQPRAIPPGAQIAGQVQPAHPHRPRHAQQQQQQQQQQQGGGQGQGMVSLASASERLRSLEAGERRTREGGVDTPGPSPQKKRERGEMEVGAITPTGEKGEEGGWRREGSVEGGKKEEKEGEETTSSSLSTSTSAPTAAAAAQYDDPPHSPTTTTASIATSIASDPSTSADRSDGDGEEEEVAGSSLSLPIGPNTPSKLAYRSMLSSTGLGLGIGGGAGVGGGVRIGSPHRLPLDERVGTPRHGREESEEEKWERRRPIGVHFGRTTAGGPHEGGGRGEGAEEEGEEETPTQASFDGEEMREEERQTQRRYEEVEQSEEKKEAGEEQQSKEEEGEGPKTPPAMRPAAGDPDLPSPHTPCQEHIAPHLPIVSSFSVDEPFTSSSPTQSFASAAAAPSSPESTYSSVVDVASSPEQGQRGGGTSTAPTSPSGVSPIVGRTGKAIPLAEGTKDEGEVPPLASSSKSAAGLGIEHGEGEGVGESGKKKKHKKPGSQRKKEKKAKEKEKEEKGEEKEAVEAWGA